LTYGARIAAVKLDLVSASPDADFFQRMRRAPAFIDLGHLDPALGSAEAPRPPKAGSGLRSPIYRHALTMGRDGRADAGLLHAIQQECHAPCAPGL